MTFSLAILDELARAYGEEIPAEVRSALARIEAAGVTRDAGASLVTVAVERPSKAAERTRRWRERKRLAAMGLTSPEASQPVTEASPIVTAVTVRDVTGDGVLAKKVPPTPPLEKNKPLPQKGVSKRRRRHPVTFDAPQQQPAFDKVFVDEHDARFREIERISGRKYPRSGTGWYFAPFLVQQAEERIRSTVHHLRPSSLAIDAASGAGPPGGLRKGLSR